MRMRRGRLPRGDLPYRRGVRRLLRNGERDASGRPAPSLDLEKSTGRASEGTNACGRPAAPDMPQLRTSTFGRCADRVNDGGEKSRKGVGSPSGHGPFPSDYDEKAVPLQLPPAKARTNRLSPIRHVLW